MTFPYKVNFNGTYFKVGEDITLPSPIVSKVEPKIEPLMEETKKYTKSEILHMTTDELKKLAKSENLDDSLTGTKLKEVLVSHFGL